MWSNFLCLWMPSPSILPILHLFVTVRAVADIHELIWFSGYWTLLEIHLKELICVVISCTSWTGLCLPLFTDFVPIPVCTLFSWDYFIAWLITVSGVYTQLMNISVIERIHWLVSSFVIQIWYIILKFFLGTNYTA